MNDFFVYILLCADNSYYVGHTDDIEKRIAEHNSGSYEGYTSTRLPVKIVYVEVFASRDEAVVAERQIKGWSRKKEEALINKNWESLKILAKCKLGTMETVRFLRQAQDERVSDLVLNGLEESLGKTGDAL